MINYYQPSKIHLGEGRLDELSEIIKKYGSKCLLVTTPNIAPLDKLYARVINDLNENGVEVVHFDKVEPNPTVEIVEEGLSISNKEKADVVLAVGGGSSIDTAKIIALTNGLDSIDWDNLFSNYTNPFGKYEKISKKELPFIAVSTTSGTGSQVTQAAVISRGKDKNTIFHPNNFSREAIIDPELMVTLPPRITASTGFDAFTHAFESYINGRASEFTEIQSLRAMELVVENLEYAVKDGLNMEYRRKLAIADTLAGCSLANAGASAPHPLSEIIGGITKISHGEALAVVFPSFVNNEYRRYIEKFAIVARIFNKDLINESDEVAAEKLGEEIEKFITDIGLKTKLLDFEVSKEQLDEIVSNPILGVLPFGKREDLVKILEASF